MKILILVGIITWVVSIIVAIYFISIAPEGYEDEEGFHYEDDERNKPCQFTKRSFLTRGENGENHAI